MAAAEPAPDETKRSRRMLGFYVAMGAALALFVGGWFAWTPLRVWYWERKVRAHIPMDGITLLHAQDVQKLVGLGPPACSAVGRLLSANDPVLYMYLMSEIQDSKSAWALPALVRHLRENRKSCDMVLLQTVEIVAGCRFIRRPGQQEPIGTEKDYAEARSRILAWWDGEGKAKYGHGAPKLPGSEGGRGAQ